MPLSGATILSVAIHDGAAALALLERGARGVRVVGESTLEPTAGMLSDSLGAESARLVGSRRVDEIVLVLSSAYCATREIALTPADWGSAKTGVLESLEDLVPIPSDDAIVGLLGLCDEDERCTRGVIVACRRSVVDPLLAAVEASAPDAAVTVLSFSMAAVGLESDGRVWVTDEEDGTEPGVVLEHGLPVGQESEAGEFRRVVIGRDVSLVAIAVAGVQARRAAPDVIVPLVGHRPGRVGRYLKPALTLAAALLLLAAVPMVWSSRLEQGTNDAIAKRAALQDEFRESQQERARAERFADLCDAFDGVSGAWESVTPVLQDTAGALGEDGFLYRLRYEGGTLSFTGESPDPGSVLERLEAAVTLENASQTTPLTPSPVDPEMLVFTFRAEGVGR